MTAPAETPRARRPAASRALHALGQGSATASAAVLAAVVSLGFLVAALLARHASEVLTSFEALAAAVTLVMVFALQHTQARQQTALQRKLDEILRVLPGADTRLVHLETAADPELVAAGESHDAVRAHALGEA